MAHPIAHVEISATDPVTLARFYESLFGWGYEHYPDMGNYVSFTLDGLPGVGLNQGLPPGASMAYVESDDVAATLAQAVALGAETQMEPMEVPGVGTMATFRDPQGNLISLMQWAMPPQDAP